MKEKLDAFLNKILQEKHIAGFSVAITDCRQVIYTGGFGLMDAENASALTQPATLYRIASITKIVTGMVILKLCEENRLSLSEPVTTYIPWLRNIPRWKGDITLTHLLSHTAGLPVEYTPDGPRDESLLEESLKKELMEIPEIPDGDRGYLYSNLGIRLASLAAQNVAGEPYSVLARKYVLDPLGMAQTNFDLKKMKAPYTLSFPHTYSDGGFEVSHYIMENAVRLAAGGLYSNVLDLSKLARCILNEGKNDGGSPVLSAESMAQMRRQRARAAEGRGYGLTTQIFAYPDGLLHGHLGNANPYCGSLLVDMEKGIGVCLLMNTFFDSLRTELPMQILEHLKAYR